jgi:hypothetical protein
MACTTPHSRHCSAPFATPNCPKLKQLELHGGMAGKPSHGPIWMSECPEPECQRWVGGPNGAADVIPTEP